MTTIIFEVMKPNRNNDNVKVNVSLAEAHTFFTLIKNEELRSFSTQNITVLNKEGDKLRLLIGEIEFSATKYYVK